MSESRVWHKSSYSSGGADNCVEVAAGAQTLMRDTQHREHGHLSFPSAEWSAFLSDLEAL
ncbi:DUF397 domain-containing protein [Streptomonospora litoralis]|uniref:DUF397 domain-containing protein n=1 Tax=Streptomonospora litoralis TaxID=2498135 RepID=A0A4P6QAK9_9ACTN|nr:DUF397 domain-containing protein [Streptomonospora litoralis]QBI56589.1 hypothetical protein EKD16_24220 [Streptomonospora litoralis]